MITERAYFIGQRSSIGRQTSCFNNLLYANVLCVTQTFHNDDLYLFYTYDSFTNKNRFHLKEIHIPTIYVNMLINTRGATAIWMKLD